MTYPILLYVNGVEVGDKMEWGISCEEILGGQGRATIVVQDRANSWEPQAHWDVKVVVQSSGWVLFRGEIIVPSLELPVGFPWRRWSLDCADYNGELNQRLVGAIDGTHWTDIDGFGDFIASDLYANTLASDKLTVQQLFDHYIRVAGGTAIETSTFVGEYWHGDQVPWTYSDLQAALEELASFVSINLQFWVDPDLKLHWVAVPAWQDLAQEVVTGVGSLARMFPEFLTGTLGTAPWNINMDAPDGVTSISGRELKVAFDGSAMPEEIYVRGGTGFVYNNGAGDFSTGSVAPAPITPGSYLLTFNAATLVYSRHATGYIALPGTSFGTIGQTVYVNPTTVPIDPTNLTGGSFWEMKSGSKVGWLVSFWSNRLGYGNITVVKVADPVPTTPPAVVPTIGIGGSGWAGYVAQDPNKRQAYFDAPSSVTQAMRESIGAQALYRGKYSTLRGSVKVSGVDGWRAGQLIQISDVRLTASLNGRYFIIQRVQSSALIATDVREYVLDWGDGPVGRFSAQQRQKQPTPPPAVQVIVDWVDLPSMPGTTKVIVGQLANFLGVPWAIAGKLVDWSVLAFDVNGNLVTGQGSLSPTESVTDRNGQAKTTFVAGTTPGLLYFVYASTPAV